MEMAAAVWLFATTQGIELLMAHCVLALLGTREWQCHLGIALLGRTNFTFNERMKISAQRAVFQCASGRQPNKHTLRV